MKERFSKMLLTSALTVLLGASMGNLSANEHDSFGYDRCFDRCYDSCDFCCDEPKFALWADFLWWDACQTGLDVAVVDNGAPGAVITDGETHFFEHRYKPGFRVGASYAIPCDCWSIDFQYTMWHPKQHHTYTAGFGGTLDATAMASWIALGALTEAKSELKTKYDLYDLVLAKTYRCGDCSKVRPYFGARFLQFRQQFTSVYTPAAGGIAPRAQWRTDLPVGGFTIGAEGKYHVCNNWSVTGRLGASLLGGRAKHHNEWFSPGTGASNGVRSEHRHHSSVITGWDAALGIAYDWCCCNNPVGVAVGYEIQDWWNMPQRPRFVDQSTGNTSVTNDDGARFTAHGLFVRAGVAF